MGFTTSSCERRLAGHQSRRISDFDVSENVVTQCISENEEIRGANANEELH